MLKFYPLSGTRASLLHEGPDPWADCHPAVEAGGKGVTAGEQASVNNDLVEFLQQGRNQIKKDFNMGTKE